MPTIYESGERISELNGKVEGGSTIVIKNVQEIEGLIALVSLSGKPNENPLVSIFKELDTKQVDLEEWQRFGEKKSRFLLSNDDSFVSSTESEVEDWEKIVNLLRFVKELWERENKKEPKNRIYVTLTIANLTENPDGELFFSSGNPAIVFHKGSYLAKLSLNTLFGVVRITNFCIGISGRGISATKRAENIVEELRNLAITDLSKENKEPQLIQLGNNDAVKDLIANKEGAIVFLHGLMSTDVGTFKELIEHLKADDKYGDKFAYFGWPHDTFTSIANNAKDLGETLYLLMKDDEKPVVFICHSRGGLVARSTAVWLYNKPNPRWRTKLKGCITFGTPHYGAVLAEVPEELIATYIILNSIRNPISPLFDDAIWYTERKGSLEGILDLKPGGAFLKELSDEESKQVPKGREELRLLEICAIGGDYDITEIPDGELGFFDRMTRRLANSVIGQNHGHDLVVRTSSSKPWRIPNTGQIGCNHFDYFKDHYIHNYPEIVFDCLARFTNKKTKKPKRAKTK